MVRAPAIGVTGGLGCGKSEVGRLLSARGVAVLDADAVAHRLLAPGTPTQKALVDRFGTRVLEADGQVDRTWLAEKVFGSSEERADLNAIMHPPVLDEIRQWVAERRGRLPLAVLVPLLYEVGLVDPWDAVLCVAANVDVAHARLRLRGWSDAEIGQRLAAQWPLAEKVRRADAVIWNNGTKAELAVAVEKTWNELSERSR